MRRSEIANACGPGPREFLAALGVTQELIVKHNDDCARDTDECVFNRPLAARMACERMVSDELVPMKVSDINKIEGVVGAVSDPVIPRACFRGVLTNRRRFLKLAALAAGGAGGGVLISRVLE